MKSKTKIDKQIRRKTSSELVETIIKAKKNKAWLEVASILSSPRRRKIDVNLDKIDKESEEGDTVVVPGKVLGDGEISKKISIAALSFSEQAREKLQEKKCKIFNLIEEIKSNPKGEGIKIIK